MDGGEIGNWGGGVLESERTHRLAGLQRSHSSGFLSALFVRSNVQATDFTGGTFFLNVVLAKWSRGSKFFG